jgi:transposase
MARSSRHPESRHLSVQKGVDVAHAPESWQEAVRLYRVGQRGVRPTATQPGPAAGTLHMRVRRAEVDEGLKVGLTSEERAELLRLRREVRILEEQEILGKAVLFFTRRPIGARGAPPDRGAEVAPPCLAPGPYPRRNARGLPRLEAASALKTLSAGRAAQATDAAIHAAPHGIYGAPRVHTSLAPALAFA